MVVLGPPVRGGSRADGERRGGKIGQAGPISVDELAGPERGDRRTGACGRAAGSRAAEGRRRAARGPAGGSRRRWAQRLNRGESARRGPGGGAAVDPSALPGGGRGRGQVGSAAGGARGAGAVRPRVLEARSAIGVALWYPILVLSLAYLLFLGLVVEVIPRFIAAFESLGLRNHLRRCAGWSGSASSLPTGGRSGRSCSCCWSLAWWRSGVAATFHGRPGRWCGSSPGWARCSRTTSRPASRSCWPCCSSTGWPIPRR